MSKVNGEGPVGKPDGVGPGAAPNAGAREPEEPDFPPPPELPDLILAVRMVNFRLLVGGQQVTFPISEDLYAHFMDQFYRRAPTDGFRHRYATLMNLMREAYRAGYAAGQAAQ